jgi:DNA-binding LacI/PurR family transcriptional regulator
MGSETRKRKGRVTLKRVAAELGISAMTVSNAYNRPDQLSAGLRERILATARRMGYEGPDPVGRGLRRGRTGAIGVLYDNRLSFTFDDPGALAFLQGVTVAAAAEDLGLLLIPGSSHRPPAGPPGEAMVDGFIAYSVARDDPILQSALDRGVPVVTVDQPRIAGVPFVGADDERGARAAAEHLLSLGHERFGIVSLRLAPETAGGLVDEKRRETARYQMSQLRLRGYLATLAEAGISPESVPVYEAPGRDARSGRAAAEALLAGRRRPTALLAAGDRLALGAVAVASKRGLRVPEHLSVVGFDDLPSAAYADPPLTTVHQEHEEKGVLAGRALILEIEGKKHQDHGPLPARLVVRGSTARAAS